MIVRDRPKLHQLFFIVRGSIVPRVIPQMLTVAGLAVVVVLVGQYRPVLLPKVSGGPFALMGIALSIFLSFRNSACYDRWWEARRHWGELVIASRDLARQTLIFATEAPEARRRLLSLTIAFSHALVTHLRSGAQVGKVSGWLKPTELARFQAAKSPDFILQLMGEELAALRARQHLSDIVFQILDQTIGQMSMVQASCERIRNTPVPFGYTLLLHRTAYLFCFILPFGFADVLGWTLPFAVAVVAYTFFGLDAMSDELEEPFGVMPNDLPIETLAYTIEINMREALGEVNLPPLPQPVDYVLM